MKILLSVEALLITLYGYYKIEPVWQTAQMD